MAKKMVNKKRNNYRYLKDIIEKRYIFLIIVIIILFSIIGIRLFYLQIIKNDLYSEKLLSATSKTIESTSVPRGRIYDRNYNIIVDNQAVKTIYYKKESGITKKEEIELAYKVAALIDIDYSNLTENQIKAFWLINNFELGNKKITEEEWKKYSSRKLTSDDLYDLKLSRVTEEEISIYEPLDKEAIMLYNLMNKGYSYAEKIIKNKDVTEKEYAIISENISNLSGFNTKLDWERIYPYGDVFRSILGKISSNSQGIPKELVDDYLSKGYSLNDRVGISYLEYQYEDYLKGEKAKYKLNSDNSYELVSEGKRGNDIVLTIDINLQKEVESILSYEVLNAKKEKNTEYYNRSFALIEDPKTGEILAMSGKQVLKDDKGNNYIVDYTPGAVTLPVTPGSIVKGASISVGYKYGAIDIGSSFYDSCIKIKATPLKCSWKNLGNTNDIKALAYSSNIYQFMIAIKVGNGNYKYNEALKIDEDAFNKYRDMYAAYGLGVKTGIDLPVESLGYSGTSKLSGHLLDFSIGQYDTYTPIQLLVYISTLANNGTRLKPYLLKEVYEPNLEDDSKFGKKIYSSKVEVVGEVPLDIKYINRIKEGFKACMNALCYGYMGKYTSSAGKTGTSQSFIDTDKDGVVDTETITNTFGGFAPYDDPKFSIVVVSPDVSNGNGYNSGVNKRISAKIVNKFFEIY